MSLGERFPLRTLARIMGGGTPSKETAAYWNGDIPWVSPKDMWVDEVMTSEDMITPEAVRSSATNLVPPNAILCVVRSGILARRFPVAITRREVAINQDIKAIIPSGKLDPRYLYYFMRASEPAILAGVTTGATVHRVSTSALTELAIPLPPLEEQRRIVAVLDEAFAAIATATANAEKNLTKARALFDACSAKLFASNEPDWRVLPLGAVSNFQGGSQPPKSTFVSEPRAGYVRLLQIRDFKSDKSAVYIPEAKRNKLCEANDIMIARYGASVGQIHRGKAGAYNVALIRTIPNADTIDRDYFYYFLKSPLFQVPLMAVASRSAQDGFGKDDIVGIEVPVPPLIVQTRIIGELRSIDDECRCLASLYEKKIGALAQLKLSILQSAFAGELAETEFETIAA